MMTERVKGLRRESISAVPTLSPERAELITRFYRNAPPNTSAPVMRAFAFKYLMENKAVCINAGEIIVGEKGPAPKAAPTYPELCCHSLRDLDILNSREKIPFKVSRETRETYRKEIIPFWKGKSMRDMIFKKMSKAWRDAYDAGVFTEFMEQRAPGHTVLDDKIYGKGLSDFKRDIARSLAALDQRKGATAQAKREELRAMSICADALIAFARRHAEKARKMARNEKDLGRKKELLKIAEVCERVPKERPRDFREALQYYWFVHLGVTTELNTWDAFDPGHLDQHLQPFYEEGVGDGTLTREGAEELLQCFWIKFNNQPAPPKVGVTAAESGTYTDFAQINTGGLRADGSDAVSDVTYLLLDVIEEMRLLQPSASIQVSEKSPDLLITRAARIIRTGFGQPSVFNSDMIVRELVRQGKSVEDARCGGSSGCVEVGAFGKESYILTGYFNMPKVLEIALNNGRDPRTGKVIGLRTGDPARFASFDQLYRAYERQLRHFVDIKMKGNAVIERLYAERMPSPFLSLLIDDCIAKGMDYHFGGARYNTSYIQGVGLGTMADCMASINYNVFDKKQMTMSELLNALRIDFKGGERLRQQLLNKTPKYGNDNDYTDDIMRRIFDTYFSAIDGRPNWKGGEYHINLLPTTVHVYFGSMVGALPDGRRARQPLSEGVSPVQGADRQGPTAVLKSVAKMDHWRTGGTLLNMKLTPKLLEGDEGLGNLAHLVRAYFKLGGHHVQFNVVDAKTLRAAQKDPSAHRDLIVRVAGYSDYFCDLGKALQDEIIARTEHRSV